MKKIMLSVLLAGFVQIAFAQKSYKADFENKPANTFEMMMGSGNVTIIGQPKNEITIESTKNPGSPAKTEMPEMPKKPEMPEDPERAKGLKPLTPSSTDNTGLGLTVEKSDGHFTVTNISPGDLENNYTFYIPDNVKVVINDVKHGMKSSYALEKLKGEINISSVNSDFKVTGVTGPVVLQTANGNVEVSYSDMTPNKPNSLTAVNGYVDVTMPAAVKANLKLQAVNGKAYSDFDIKTEKSQDMMPAPSSQIFVLAGTINGGGAPFSISAVNGDIYLRKK